MVFDVHSTFFSVCFHTSESLRSVCSCKVRLAVHEHPYSGHVLSIRRENLDARWPFFFKPPGDGGGKREKVTPAKHPLALVTAGGFGVSG